MNLLNLATKQVLRDYGYDYPHILLPNNKFPKINKNLLYPVKISLILEYAIYIRRFMDRYPQYSEKIMNGNLDISHINHHKRAYNQKVIENLATDLTIFPSIVYTYNRTQEKTTKGDATNDKTHQRNI